MTCTTSMNSKRSSTILKDSNLDDGIKEYAESAMNELLGWYGYEKLRKSDFQKSELSIIKCDYNRVVPAVEISSNGESEKMIESSPSNVSHPLLSLISSPSTSSSSDESGIVNRVAFKKLKANRKTDIIDTQIRGKRTDQCEMTNTEYSSCGWCHKVKRTKNSIHNTIDDRTTVFCSQTCLTRFRNFNTRQSKACDWCGTTTRAVTTVDLDDGDSQFQFCRQKCLNQYKLAIFCQETKEHLEIHPHHRQQRVDGVDDGDSVSTLITPDLWLRNCVSPTPQRLSPEPSVARTNLIDFKDKLDRSSRSTDKCDEIGLKRKRRKSPPILELTTSNDSTNTTDPAHAMTMSQNSHKTIIAPAQLNLQVESTPNTSNNLSHSRIPALLPIFKQHSTNNGSTTSSSSTNTPSDTSFGSLLPPATVIVPYPIILPLPIPLPFPIPIPIPVSRSSNFSGMIEEEIDDAMKKNYTDTDHVESDYADDEPNTHDKASISKKKYTKSYDK